MEIGRIYCITCLTNGKMYIGQTSKTLKLRWEKHLCDAIKRKFDYKFYRAIRKYGVENFVIEEIMWVETPNKHSLKRKLDFLERHFIARYDTKRRGYNSTEGGDGVLGLHVSDETREKLRLLNLGKKMPNEVRNKIGNAHRGMKRSKQTCEHIRIAHLGNKNPMFGKHLSYEHRRRIGISLQGRRSPTRGMKFSESTRRKMSESKGMPEICQFSLDGKLLKTWINIATIKRKVTGINRETLKIKIQQHLPYKGFIWKFKN